MTPEQKAAFINAQSVMMQTQLQGMIAENTQRERDGLALAYSEEGFNDFYDNWFVVLGYNSIIQFFRD